MSENQSNRNTIPKVSVYVRNKTLSPSGYYRVIQYAKKFPCETIIHSIVPNWMFELGLKIKKHKILNKIWNIIYYIYILIKTYSAMLSDKKQHIEYVIVSKAFIPRICPDFFINYIAAFLDGRILIWDFDDLIIGNTLPQNEADLLMEKSQTIVVTHEFLRESLPERYRYKVLLMPTTDGDMLKTVESDTIRKKLFFSNINVLWLATAVNLPNLKLAMKGLDLAAKRLRENGKILKLVVVCNMPFHTETQWLEIENILWSREAAITQTMKCHIGIMPLEDTEFNRGKGAFKLIQYMATGMPVVASAVGFNKKVVNEKIGVLVGTDNDPLEWSDAICHLCQSIEVWNEYSENSFKEWEEKFSYNKNLETWLEIIGAV